MMAKTMGHRVSPKRECTQLTHTLTGGTAMCVSCRYNSTTGNSQLLQQPNARKLARARERESGSQSKTTSDCVNTILAAAAELPVRVCVSLNVCYPWLSPEIFLLLCSVSHLSFFLLLFLPTSSTSFVAAIFALSISFFDSLLCIYFGSLFSLQRERKGERGGKSEPE